MPNITITVDDHLYRAARIHAVNRNTMVTEVVRQFLFAIVKHTGEYNYAQHAELVVRWEQAHYPGVFRAKGYNTPPPSPLFSLSQ